MRRLFYWSGLHADVYAYVTSCDLCQSNKSSSTKSAGLLQSIPTPDIKWGTVSMDLITQLPKTKTGHTAIVVFVDKLTKLAHFVACKTEINAPQLAQLFYDHVIKSHGVPNTIISDRDARFTSRFWRELWQRLDTKLAMSTSYHPQSDGQTERTNRILEDMLRNYVSYRQNDWDERLTAAEISYNNAVQDSTGFSPYYLNSGMHMKLPLSMSVNNNNNGNVNAANGSSSSSSSSSSVNATCEQLIEQMHDELQTPKKI